MQWNDLGKDVQQIIISYGFQVEDFFSQWKSHFKGGTNWCRLRRVCKEWKEMADSLYVFPLQAFLLSLKNVSFLRYLSKLPANRIITEDREIIMILHVILRDGGDDDCEMYKEAYTIFLDLPITFDEEHYYRNFQIVEKFSDAEITRKFMNKYKWELHCQKSKFDRWILKSDIELIKVLLDRIPQSYIFSPQTYQDDVPNMSEEVLWILFHSGRVEFRSMFNMAYMFDQVEIVGRLLSNSHNRIGDHEINRYWQKGSIDMMKLLVEVDERIFRCHEEICTAIENDDEEMLREFISRRYPATNKIYMLYIASQKGMIKSMKILLEDQSLAFNQTKKDLSPIIDAASYGQFEAVELLLKDKRNSDLNTIKALMVSVEKQHQEICKLILENKDLDFSEALPSACKVGNQQIVQCLLERSQINPSINQSNALREAIVHNHPKIVELLLKDRGSDPSWDNTTILLMVAELGHLSIMKLLMEHPRVEVNSDLVELIRETAFNNGHFEIIQLVSNGTSVGEKKDEEVIPSSKRDWNMAYTFCGII